LKTVTFAVPAVATSLAGMVAVSTVLETNPVVRSLPFQRTTELVTKFVPVMVSVNPPLPATAVDGLIVVIVGNRLVMVKVAVLDVPPPGAGLKAVTFAVPAVATSLAGMVAVSTVLETKVVGRSLPFQRTTAPLTKFVPVMVRVNPPLPATAVDGLIVVIVGNRLVMVKVAVLDVPPPGAGLKAVTFAVPAVATSLAGMVAVSTVLETNPVVRSLPFQRTTEPLTKFVPVMVSVKPLLPATVVAGLMLLIVGAGLLMVNVTAPDSPPPGAGLKTVTFAVPAVAMSLAGMAAVSWVLETKVVGRSFPFQRTTEPVTKFVPVTVRVNPPLPATVVAGLIVVIVGDGFVMVKVAVLDVPPPGAGLKTVTFAVPAVATSLAGMVAVSTVLDTNPVVRLFPFQRTTAPVTKFVPVMVRVNPPLPATVVAGLIVVIVGDGFVMVKVAVLDVPPPGAGLKTVTFAVPAVATSLAGMAAVS